MENISKQHFNTEVITIEEITKRKLEFLIPVYQRPYVWDDLEIIKLLEDLKNSFQAKINEYFVGNTYIVKSKKSENKINLYEVIDGQQRFTTIWLFGFCFKFLGIKTGLIEYLEVEIENNLKDIRFDFDIRVEVYEYLKGLLDNTSQRRFETVEDKPFLKNIAAGIETIKGFFNAQSPTLDLLSFGNYINQNVKFIFNIAPENTDLNGLFVALGTNGIQLQQSDILKARLLDRIEKRNRICFSKIWEACENMNNFFEQNVKESFFYDKNTINEDSFSSPLNFVKFGTESYEKINKEVKATENENTNLKQNKTISEILDFEVIYDQSEKSSNSKHATCRSIISFNLLLLHTFRIYRKNKEIKEDIDSFDAKKLLETIKPEEIENIEDFFKLLWQVRYIFDKHIVKWMKQEDDSVDDDEKLLLSKIAPSQSVNKDKNYFARSAEGYTNLQMLQSVLYFTGGFNQQYWLSPFLSYLLEREKLTNDDENILKELERIDNIMLPGDKKDISLKLLMSENLIEPDFEKEIYSVLKENSGTSFNHYWFYKLEYLLWKNWIDKETLKFKNYRITSKNSIEHVFPQNEEYKGKLQDAYDETDWLNSFGNLGLLSIGQNSSYSNLSVVKKKDDFNRKENFDSLKLVKIYSSPDWGIQEIKDHQVDMINLLKEHYK